MCMKNQRDNLMLYMMFFLEEQFTFAFLQVLVWGYINQLEARCTKLVPLGVVGGVPSAQLAPFHSPEALRLIAPKR